MRLQRSTLHRSPAHVEPSTRAGNPRHVDGIHELAASSGNSPTITRRLVVSYTRLLTLTPPNVQHSTFNVHRSCVPSVASDQRSSATFNVHRSTFNVKEGRSFSSSLTSCRQLLLFSEVEHPVLPGLSSRVALVGQRQRQSRGSAFVLQRYE